MEKKELVHILNQFKIQVSSCEFTSLHNGFINDTFLVTSRGIPVYILQKINESVFKDVDVLSNNINKALNYLKAEDYKAIKLIETRQGATFYKSQKGCWRLMNYIQDSITYNITNNKEIAFEAGRIIGKFHKLLENTNITDFKEVLPDFHNLPFRLSEFNSALENALSNRKKSAEKDIANVDRMLGFISNFSTLNLPVRICHNDTKLNNILFSIKNKGLCLIDLDTIMPGYIHYDIGDALRTILNPVDESEIDLNKIKFNRELFLPFIEGLAKQNIALTQTEIETLPLSVVLMPFLHGLRALTDYLNNDVYYKTTYKNQNLDRARGLLHFAWLAQQQLPFMETIIKKYWI